MKHIIYYFALVVLAEIACSGATAGSPYTIRDWTTPKQIIVPALGGTATVSLQSSAVIWGDSASGLMRTLDQVEDPDSKALCIGRTADQYFLSAKSIYGARISGNILLIQSSVTPSVITGDESTVVSNALFRILKDPDMDFSEASANYRFDLRYIFSESVLVPHLNSQSYQRAASLTGVKIDDNGITFSMFSLIGQQLELTVTPTFIVKSAAVNGRPSLVLDNGTFPKAEGSWPFPLLESVSTSTGNKLALTSAKLDSNNNSWKTVTVTESGALWFGPTQCKVVSVGGQLIGVMPAPGNEANEIVFYRGPYANIPLSPDSWLSYQQEVKRLETQVNNSQFKETSRLNIPSVLNNAPIASRPLQGVSVRGNNLILTINTPDDYIEISLTSDLMVVSTARVPRE